MKLMKVRMSKLLASNEARSRVPRCHFRTYFRVFSLGQRAHTGVAQENFDPWIGAIQRLQRSKRERLSQTQSCTSSPVASVLPAALVFVYDYLWTYWSRITPFIS